MFMTALFYGFLQAIGTCMALFLINVIHDVRYDRQGGFYLRNGNWQSFWAINLFMSAVVMVLMTIVFTLAQFLHMYEVEKKETFEKICVTTQGVPYKSWKDDAFVCVTHGVEQ